MQQSTKLNVITVIIALFYSCTVLNAHEFWIAPDRFIVNETEKISANLRVGQMMRGTAYGYYPRHFKRFEVKTNTKLHPLEGRLGDKPAISLPPQGNSLITIIHQTTNSTISYNSWAKFEEFITEKSMLEVRDQHIRNKYPKTEFKEIYSRYAKALIGSGSSIGIDQKIGLEVELVLLQNPYTDDLSEGLIIELFYQGQALTNTQIEVFARNPEKEVTRSTVFTNEFGQVLIKTLPQTDYMLNSVIIRKPKKIQNLSKNSNQPILWESLWASTTFRAP